MDEEQKISSELERRVKEAERKEREVQLMREQSVELRDLQYKLKTAQVTMERGLQLQEKRLIEDRDRAYNAAFDNYLDEERAEVKSWPWPCPLSQRVG